LQQLRIDLNHRTSNSVDLSSSSNNSSPIDSDGLSFLRRKGLMSDHHDRIAAIVLAAGLSQRMGRPKPLLPLGDKPLIRHVIQNLREAQGISQTLSITGACAAEVTAAIDDPSITI